MLCNSCKLAAGYWRLAAIAAGWKRRSSSAIGENQRIGHSVRRLISAGGCQCVANQYPILSVCNVLLYALILIHWCLIPWLSDCNEVPQNYIYYSVGIDDTNWNISDTDVHYLFCLLWRADDRILWLIIFRYLYPFTVYFNLTILSSILPIAVMTRLLFIDIVTIGLLAFVLRRLSFTSLLLIPFWYITVHWNCIILMFVLYILFLLTFDSYLFIAIKLFVVIVVVHLFICWYCWYWWNPID